MFVLMSPVQRGIVNYFPLLRSLCLWWSCNPHIVTMSKVSDKVTPYGIIFVNALQNEIESFCAYGGL